MDFKKLAGQVKGASAAAQEVAGQLSQQAVDLAGVTGEKLDGLFKEYREAVPVLEQLGFRVGRASVAMTLLPEVETSIYGALANVDDEVIAGVLEHKSGNKLLVTMLKALLAIKQIHGKLGLKLHHVRLKVKLGLPPMIVADLLESPPTDG